MRPLQLLVLVLCSTVLLSARGAEACASAPPPGIAVDIVGEDALIVWDAERQTQHFIRRADFHSRSLAELRATGFGFLVPTPSRPQLAEAPDGIFTKLVAAIRPEEITRRKYEVAWTLCTSMMLAGRDGAGIQATASVEVLEVTRVAGYDAAVLKADDAEALSTWLTEHGYAYRPELKAWLEAYVARDWIITAFKIAVGDDRASSVGSAAVRMTFKTERPFFPYREPSDQGREAHRQLFRLFLIAPERMDGVIGEHTRWPAELLHAAPTDASELLAGALPDGAQPPQNAWLHAFVDRSSPRLGQDDLLFGRHAEQSEKRQSTIVHHDTVTIPLLLDVVALLLLLGWGTVRLSRRKRRSS